MGLSVSPGELKTETVEEFISISDGQVSRAAGTRGGVGKEEGGNVEGGARPSSRCTHHSTAHTLQRPQEGWSKC